MADIRSPGLTLWVSLLSGVAALALCGGVQSGYAATRPSSPEVPIGNLEGAVVPAARAAIDPEVKVHSALVRRLADRGEGQPVKAWVLFTDKGLATERAAAIAVTEVASRYNPRAIERRRMRRTLPGLFDARDLPVFASYVDALKATGARVHLTSNWINGASVLATRAQINQIVALPFVKAAQPVRHGRHVEPVDVQPSSASRGDLDGTSLVAGIRSLDYGLSAAQISQINLTALHDLGITGQGVVIGILDSGFKRTHEAFTQSGHVVEVLAEWDFINNDGNTDSEVGSDPAGQHYHGTYILGTLAAYLPGWLVGAAFDASFILCKTEDTGGEYPAEEDNYVAGLEFIEAHGGDVATSSLGYIDWYTQHDLDGMTAVTTLAVNAATGNGLHCCTAAGNDGHDASSYTSHLIAPADAFQVITCGAVNSAGLPTYFTSDGPTADGRVKPELLAWGLATQTVDPGSFDGYVGVNGTSLSTPLVAGAVACLVQLYPDWTVDQMRRRLFHTADYYVSHGTFDPFYTRGYGVLDAFAAGLSDCNANDVQDWVEVDEGAAADCNGNSIPDECDIDGGAIPDCNDNGVPDECEVPRHVVSTSDVFTPLARFVPYSHTLPAPPQALSEVVLTFKGRGDLGDGEREAVGVELNGAYVGSIFTVQYEEPPQCPPLEEEITVSAEAFNNAVAEGQVVITVIPTAGVHAGVCKLDVDDVLDYSFIVITVSYDGAGLVPDCNDSGIPDECEAGDHDGDGRLTLGDWPGYGECFTGPCSDPPCVPSLYADPCCVVTDSDGDGDTDLADAARFCADFAGH